MIWSTHVKMYLGIFRFVMHWLRIIDQKKKRKEKSNRSLTYGKCFSILIGIFSIKNTIITFYFGIKTNQNIYLTLFRLKSEVMESQNFYLYRKKKCLTKQNYERFKSQKKTLFVRWQSKRFKPHNLNKYGIFRVNRIKSIFLKNYSPPINFKPKIKKKKNTHRSSRSPKNLLRVNRVVSHKTRCIICKFISSIYNIHCIIITFYPLSVERKKN